MGEAKRRREKDSNYGADGFRKALVNFLDEHKQILPTQKVISIAVFEEIPTKTKIEQASIIFQDWIAQNKLDRAILLSIGQSQDTSLAVGLVDEKNIFHCAKGKNTNSVLAALFTLLSLK